MPFHWDFVDLFFKALKIQDILNYDEEEGQDDDDGAGVGAEGGGEKKIFFVLQTKSRQHNKALDKLAQKESTN